MHCALDRLTMEETYTFSVEVTTSILEVDMILAKIFIPIHV